MSQDWLDGPRFYAWLRENGLTALDRQLGHSARRVRDWRDGAVANVYAADRVLVKVGLHLNDVPEDLYREPPDRTTRKAKRCTAAERQEILRRWAAGDSRYSIAKDLGRHRRTVEKIVARAAA